PLYFGPTQFNATAGAATSNPVNYSLINNPTWLIIDSATGVIQGTPTDNINDPGSYNITVIATNYCGAAASTDFTITVIANEWCGDGVAQIGFGEYCDNTDLDGETCASLGYGAGTLQCDSDCAFDMGQCYCIFDVSNFDSCIIQ
ncbi:Ig domain-containing protein, partial [Candidatus Parcubacteria bacterium]|nr:Ig domain-containing protein [Candidatus Parcubacteria bacterium]